MSTTLVLRPGSSQLPKGSSNPSNGQARLFAQSRQASIANASSFQAAASSSDEDDIQWTGSQSQAAPVASTSRAGPSRNGPQSTGARRPKRKTRSPSLEVITKSSPMKEPKRKRRRVESRVADTSDDDDLEILSQPVKARPSTKRPAPARIDEEDDDDDDLPPPLLPVHLASRPIYRDEPQLIDSRSSSVCASQSPNHLPVPSISAPVPRKKVVAAINRMTKPALARNSSQSKGSSTDSLTNSALAFWDRDEGVTTIPDNSPPHSPNTPPSDHEEDEVLLKKSRLQPPSASRVIETIEDSDSDGSPPPLEPASASFSHREKELADRLEKVYNEATAERQRQEEDKERRWQYDAANPQVVYDSDDDDDTNSARVTSARPRDQQALRPPSVPPSRSDSFITSSTARDQRSLDGDNDVVMSSRDPSSDIQLGITPDHLVPALNVDDLVVPAQVEDDPMPFVLDPPFEMQLLPPTPHKPPDPSSIKKLSESTTNHLRYPKTIRIAPRHYTTDKTDNLVTHFPSSFHIPKTTSGETNGASKPAIRRRLPFLARSLLPLGKQTYRGKFVHLHLALSELGYASSLARLCAPPDIDQTRTTPARFDLQYVFGRCGHHQQLDVFRFDGLRCCWCRDLHAFTSPGALMAHLRHSHEACNYLYKPIAEGGTTKSPQVLAEIRCTHYRCKESVKPDPFFGHVLPSLPVSARTESRQRSHDKPRKNKAKIMPPRELSPELEVRQPTPEPETWLEQVARLAVDDGLEERPALPTWAFKTGMKYRVQPRDGLRKQHRVGPAPKKGLPYLRTADFSALELGEVVYDSEEDDGQNYQWESRRQQHRLAEHIEGPPNVIYMQQIWYLTTRAWGPDYASKIYDVANKMISVNAVEINRRQARVQLSQLLIRLAALRALSAKQIAELLTKYDNRVKNKQVPGAGQRDRKDVKPVV